MKLYLYIIVVLILLTSIKPKPFVKTPLRPKLFRELAGYSCPEGDISKTPGFFDAFGFIDPLNGQTTFSAGHRGDTIFGLPRKQYAQYYPSGVINGINWPGDRRLRIVFDWTGALDMNDTTNTVNFTDMWGYNALFDAGDTLKFYKLDVMFRVSPENRWVYLARPDSMMTPFLVLITSANPSGTWASATCNIDMRYMLVTANLHNRGAYFTTPDFAELSCYGTYNYSPSSLVTRAATYTGALPDKPTFGACTGSNFGQGFDTLQQINLGDNRTYGLTEYWDNDASKTTTASATFAFDHFTDIGPGQYPFYKRTGKKFWWSIKGASAYLASLHATNLNTDDWNADPESHNYTRDGKLFFNYVAKWGSVAVSSSRTAWTGDGGFPNGQNTIYYVENGNEDNFTTSGLSYYQRSRSDYDSLKAADVNFKFVMSGTTDLDTAFIDNLAWFCEILSTDKKFIWDVINFHHYPRTQNILGYAASLDQQVGEHGASPESDAGIGILSLYNQGCRSIYNYIHGDTTKKIWNTEYGYGNWGTPAANPSQAGTPWDIGCVPSNPTWDSLHMKAILEARSTLIFPFTGVQVYNQFFFHNSGNQATNSPVLFYSYGMVSVPSITPPFAATVFFPNWYYNNGIYARMKWYKPITIIGAGDTTSYCHAYYQKIDSTTGLLTDSVCDVVWKTSQQGTSLSNVTVNVGFRKNNTVQTMVPSFIATIGTTGSKSVTGKTIFYSSLDEQPNFAFGIIAHPDWWIFPHKAVFKSN
jgi:hypothetical protein